MTKNDIIRMAREAGAEFAELPMMDAIVFSVDDREWNSILLERFAAFVAAAAKEEMLMAGNDQWLEEARKAEREACAKVCESKMPNPVVNWSDAQIVEALRDCAAAIRARGQV